MDEGRTFVKVGSSYIELGIYRHFKGKDYYVVGAVRDSSTMEYKVLYMSLYSDIEKGINYGDYFYRSIDEFFGDVDRNKYPNATQNKRFLKIRL